MGLGHVDARVGGLILRVGMDAPAAIEVATLNLGDRNGNSFEFVLSGDESELGQHWRTLYKRAEKMLSARGPGDHPGTVTDMGNRREGLQLVLRH